MKWRRHGFPWVLAATVVAAGLLVLGLALELPTAPKVAARGTAAELRVTGPAGAATDEVLRERMYLLDPTPLFLPSARSSSRLEYAHSGREEEGSLLGNYDARLVAAEWAGAGLSGGTAVVGLMDTVAASEVRRPFFGLGRAERPLEELPERWAVAEVYAARSHVLVERMVLPAPPEGAISSSLWSPLELLIVVGADGLIAAPETIAGSGIPEVDDYLINALSSLYGLGGDLRPGTYRLIVGQ